MRKLLVTAAMLIGLAAPSLAAEFYIVQDTNTKHCTIVEQRPTAQTTVLVGDGKVYATRGEAEIALKSVRVCEQDGSVGGVVLPERAPPERIAPERK